MEGAGSGLGLQKERVTKPLCLFRLCQSLGQPRRELLGVPCPLGRRGEPGSRRLSLSSPSQLCPFSPSPSFSLQKWPGLSSLGRKKITFFCTSKEAQTGFVCKTLVPSLAMWLSERRVLWGFFFPSPKRCFLIFSLFPHRFSLSVHGLLWQCQQKRASWPRG